MDELTNIRDLVEVIARHNGAFHLLQHRVPVRRTYAQLYRDVKTVSDTLRGWGIVAGTRVGMFAPNSYEWIVYDLAILALDAILVPFTEDFRGTIDDGTLEHHGISLLLISKSEEKAFSPLAAHIAFIDHPNSAVALRKRGDTTDSDDSDCLTRVFSSGSSGGLKGLVISRQGVLATLPPLMDALGVRKQDRLLLFLPLSNFQQRYLIYGALWKDFDVILTEHTQLFIAMKNLEPTILLAPPILYEMVYSEFSRRTPRIQRLHAAIAAVLSVIPSRSIRQAIARNLFADFYNQFGDRIRLLITGMAPIRRTVVEMFSQMQLPVSEAFGMVEAGVMTFRKPESRAISSVGQPLRDVHFTFEEDGEIVVHRPHFVASRYFQCAPGENERTFIAPNAIATGDIGHLQDGHLFLKGRKKEVIVTSAGLKIHPEVLEEQINRCPEVSKSVIFSHQHDADLHCLVLLNDPGDRTAQQSIARFLARLSSNKPGIPRFNLIFANEPFTRENGMLRPNLKIDRRRIAAAYSRAPSSPANLN